MSDLRNQAFAVAGQGLWSQFLLHHAKRFWGCNMLQLQQWQCHQLLGCVLYSAVEHCCHCVSFNTAAWATAAPSAVLLCTGDMDDLLEVLFPDDPELGLAQLHTLEPNKLQARLATRGERQHTSSAALMTVGQHGKAHRLGDMA